jgi:hypothetical protein
MKYSDDILKKYGIKIHMISETSTFYYPRLIIYHDDGYQMTYNLPINIIKNIKDDCFDFVNDIIDIHMKTHYKYIRKKKLLYLK